MKAFVSTMSSTLLRSLLSSILLLQFTLTCVCAFDIRATNNVALYWGQNSAQLSPQPPLKSYCTRPDVDIIILSFIAHLAGPTKVPILNHATPQCFSSSTNSQEAGSGQVTCPELAQEVEYCRGQGKKVLVSLGGANGRYEVLSAEEAEAAAKGVWESYLGGTGDRFVRPFGEVELDGVDLDLESPPGQEGTHWPIFIDTMRSLYQSHVGRNRKSDYLITASPQCVYPDVILSPALRDKRSWFDMLFIQFYNNVCAPTNPSSFNFNEWAEWARSSSLNPSVKLFIGAPASPSAAPSGGFTPLETLLEAASNSMEDCEDTRVFWGTGSTNSTIGPYNPFGGIAFWDASWTTAEYTAATKAGLTSSWERVKARTQFFKRRDNGEAEDGSIDTSSVRRRYTNRRRYRHQQ